MSNHAEKLVVEANDLEEVVIAYTKVLFQVFGMDGVGEREREREREKKERERERTEPEKPAPAYVLNASTKHYLYTTLLPISLLLGLTW